MPEVHSADCNAVATHTISWLAAIPPRPVLHPIENPDECQCMAREMTARFSSRLT
jgi:hypothetical protein